MMTYGDFYDIAEYGNESWCRNAFTKKEIAQNAYEYLCEFEESKSKGKLNSTMLDLVELLNQDGSEECLYWAEQIESEIYRR